MKYAGNLTDSYEIDWLSYVDETVNFEITLESTFLHDMPEVELLVNGAKDDMSLVLYETKIFLPATSTIYESFEFTFLLEGFYSIEVTITDDVGVEWSFLFSWEVFETETTVSETPSDTSSIEAPTIGLPIPTLPFAVSLSMMAIIMTIRRKYH